jgi:hypothetical protein
VVIQEVAVFPVPRKGIEVIGLQRFDGRNAHTVHSTASLSRLIISSDVFQTAEVASLEPP